MRPALKEIMRISCKLRDATLCPTCGKSTIVLNTNVGGRGVVPEIVSGAMHCACPPTDDRPAGPAHVAPGKTDADHLLGYGFAFQQKKRRG